MIGTATARAATVPGRTATRSVGWAEALRAEAPIIAIAWGYIVAIFLIDAFVVSHRDVIVFSSGDWPVVYSTLITIAAPLTMLGLMRQGHSMGRRHTWSLFFARLTPTVIVRWIIGCSLFWPFLDAFGWVKSRIPIVNPYPWDSAFARIDAVLHFGRQPWEWTAAIFPGETSVRVLDWFYGPGFAVVMLGLLFWTALVDRNHTRRLQVLVTYLIIWIVLGSVLAMVFASVGPCYYGRWLTTAADPFAPLMTELWRYDAANPLIAVTAQNHLWAGFLEQTTPYGVSAMPSVHVGIGAWVGLGLWRTRMRIAGLLFAILTLLGSVRLGWHYAIDGYVSIVIVALLWWLAGRFAARWTRPSAA